MSSAYGRFKMNPTDCYCLNKRRRYHKHPLFTCQTRRLLRLVSIPNYYPNRGYMLDISINIRNKIAILSIVHSFSKSVCDFSLHYNSYLEAYSKASLFAIIDLIPPWPCAYLGRWGRSWKSLYSYQINQISSKSSLPIFSAGWVHVNSLNLPS